MNAAQRRDFVRNLYSTRSWHYKVDRMSDSQVFAIWKKEQDKIAEAEKLAKEKRQDEDFPF